MGEHGDGASWAMVPNSGGELWASDAGEIATRKLGSFKVLTQQTNQYGEVVVTLKAGGRRKIRLVAGLILAAHGRPRVPGCRIGYCDNDPSNVALGNVLWEKKGQPRVVDLKKRKCLGNNCGVDFVSLGPGNRLCPNCLDRMGRAGDGGLDSPGSGELPDELLFDVVGNPHR